MLWLLGIQQAWSGTNTLANIGGAVGAILTALGVLFGGLAVFLPAIRRLDAKVTNVHHQVTENHHSDPDHPTLPDRLDDLARDFQALTRVMDAHLEWSDRWTELFQHELEQLKGNDHGPDSPRAST